MSEAVYTTTTSPSITEVVLNQPRKRNAISAVMMEQLAEAFLRADADPEVRVIILRGEGEHFSAGGDTGQTKDSDSPLLEGRVLLRSYLRAIKVMRGISKPVIVAADGYVIGGAFSLMVAADLVCVSDRVCVIPAFCSLGIAPEMGIAQLLPAMVGEHQAKEILLTDSRLAAEKLSQLGIANRVFPAADFLDQARAFAGEIAALPPLSVQIGKEMVNAASQGQLDMLLAMESVASPYCGEVTRLGANTREDPSA